MTMGFAINTNPIKEMVAITRHAEGLGFDGVWVGEHVVMPFASESSHPYAGRARPPIVPADDRLYDLWVIVGALIAATKRMTVSTGIALLPFRHPLVTARACLSAQQLAGGRFRLGVGGGWLAEEFEALGIPFKERTPRMEEIVAILRQVFAGRPVEHAGPKYPFPLLQMTNAPAEIPVVFGCTKLPAVRRAAVLGDGWYGTTVPLEECVAIRKEIERVRAERGLKDRPFSYHVRPLGGADRTTIDRYRAAGFDNIVMTWDTLHSEDPRQTSLDFKRRKLDAFAREHGLKP